ncbi:2-aminoethylphosphonate--pyruvate transaminase [Romboutsia weinsteinii]|uniref:2-aminoethylphosphonate--pyruvate transaminase n=1 Tax=Romboutsia weinsteinii TaxID=2020949 RepID=A0A371J6W4_9FIRM|nr:2-aminoethylphosphonate--pyruvate transaminase [Romboutsia weinsteinii]RDY28484.1 2-aminoethylphosphonate--pyruvate transaminase [Romboutsia weinsteinii]
MKNYKLLTPGPLTTTDSVKREMLFDHCTWDDDYKVITQRIRKQLLKLAHVNEEEYTTVLMQGSGTFGVESVISSVIGKEDKCLFVTNGAYGERMLDIAKYHKINYVVLSEEYNIVPYVNKVEEILKDDKDITHVMMVHCETTTGILNDIEAVGKISKKYSKTFMVDAMSSFGGIDISLKDYGIDFLISSSNKCIQGVPGFSFIIANKEKLIESKGKARSLSLDLYDQWIGMDKDGKWRFTSPTHVILAFSKALDELEAEGGVVARNKRYSNNNKILRNKMKKLGINSYLEEDIQSPIITTFLYENNDFSFIEMYNFVKENGYAIYPGKLTKVDTFRIGNIGEIYEEDINNLCDIFEKFVLIKETI